MSEKQFVVGVGDALLFDERTNQLVLKAKSLLSSAIQQTVQNTEISGGHGDKLLFDWCYGKRMNATLESATWNEEYLAISNGTSIVSGLQNFYVYDEVVNLTGGAGTVSQVPVGDLYVQVNDTYLTVTPSGSSFSVNGGANKTVKVTYRTNTSLNQIVIATDEYPTTYRLVIKSQIYAQSGAKLADFEIVIPQFKPDGAHEINFGATSASTSKMAGKALAYDAEDGREIYAYVNMKPVNTTVNYIALAATPSTVTLTTANPTKQLTVYAVQGGLKANSVVTNASAGTTYVSSTPATATVSNNGLITKVGTGTTTITITSGNLTDTVNVAVS